MLCVTLVVCAFIIAWAINPVYATACVVALCEWVQSKFSKKEEKK